MSNIMTEEEREDILAGVSGNLYFKKCPFCSAQSQKIYVQDFGTVYALVCSICCCIGPKAETEEEARQKWNTRKI